MPIFQDHFLDNRNKWPIRDNENVTLAISEGDYAYIFEHKREKGAWTAWQNIELEADADYKLHAVFEKVEGIDNNGYGLIWNQTDQENVCSFEISGDGHFRISKKVNGKWEDQRKWTKSQHIRKNNGAINELMIKHGSKRAKFYINNQLVDEFPRLTDSQKHAFGFIACSTIKIRVHSVIMLRHVDLDEEEAVEQAEENGTLESVMAELNSLIGMHDIKQEIYTLTNFLKIQKQREELGRKMAPLTYHIVLLGPPGTGKTTIARLISKIFFHLGFLSKGHLIETDRAGLVGEYIGQTAPKVEEKVKSALGGILFIDEAYSLKPQDASGRDYGQEAIDALLKRMEDYRDQFGVIIAGYTDEMMRFLESNPGVKSRFNRYFEFEHFKPPEILSIFEKFCEETDYSLTEAARSKLLAHFEEAYKARSRSFGNGRYARNLLEKVVERQANRIVEISPITDVLLTTIEAEDVPDEILRRGNRKKVSQRPIGF